MKKKLSETIADAWGVPKDVVMNIPRITISGNNEVYIENHNGILGYTDEEIRIRTAMGSIKICGKSLNIDRIRMEDVRISGRFSRVEYEI